MLTHERDQMVERRETYEADGGRNASDAVRKRVVFAAQLTLWAKPFLLDKSGRFREENDKMPRPSLRTAGISTPRRVR
jgi:hypothetical protein